MKLFIFTFLLIIPCLCLSQVDSGYIQSYPQKLMLSGYLGKDFVYITVDDIDREVMYMPNNPAKIGLGLSWKNSILSVAGGYGFDFLRNKKRGKTQSLDLQYHHYDRKFIFDFFMQRYKGFFMEDMKSSEDDFELCPDLHLYQYGIQAQYILNNKKFSYKAAFVQNEKQLRSAGSLLLGGGAYITNIQSDGSFMHMERTDLKNFQFGVNIGYAYNWVINRKWFVNGSITGGMNFGSEKISTFGSEKLKIYPTALPRVSVGFDQGNWALGFSYVNNVTFPSFTDDATVGIITGTFKLSYIRRIGDFPFLSRVMKKLRLETVE